MNQKQSFNPNFDKAVKEYLDIIGNTLRPGTVRSYKGSIYRFLDYLNSTYPEISRFKDIKRSPHIEGWLSHLAKSGMEKGTRQIHITCMRRLFADIYEWGWKDVPVPGLITSKDMPHRDKRLPKPLLPEDDKKLQDTLRTYNDLVPQSLLLLRKTGMRIGELLDLEIDSLKKVSDDQYVLKVPLGKLATERIIPVDSETVEIFNRIKDLRGHFLPIPNPRTGKPTQFLIVRNKHWRRPSYSQVRMQLMHYAKTSEITYLVTPHMLRHTFATSMVRAGISLPVLQQLMGHKDIAMTLVYVEVCQQDIYREYYKAIDKFKSMDLVPQQQENDKKDDREYISDGINTAITKLQSIRKDYPEGKNKKKLQRIAERLRKAYQDVEDTLKNQLITE